VMILSAMIMQTFDAKDRIFLMTWISVKLTIFFRRKFDFITENKVDHLLNHTWIGGILLLLLAINHEDIDWIQIIHKGFLVVSIIYDMCFCLVSIEEKIKAVFLTFSLYLAISGSIGVLCWISTCVIATTQLLRWPSALKVYLRTPRTVCGPSYTILLMGACYKDSEVAMTSFVRLPTLLEIASVSSFFATIFFRPDNHSIYMLLSSLKQRRQTLVPDNNNNNTKNHKFIHAGLMVLSYMCMIAKFFTMEYDYPFRFLGVVFIAMSFLGLFCGTTFVLTLSNRLQNNVIFRDQNL
jgi:hypothetical protein